MSFHSLPGLEVAYSEPIFSDSARSAPWKKSRTVERCSSNANGTVCFPCSRSGTTSKPSEGSLGVESWISSLLDSRASRSLSPASGKGPTTKEISGRKQSESSEKSRLVTLSLKMSLDLFDPVILDKFSKTLWVRGTMRNGVCSERTTPGPRIEEKGSGYWPTPMAQEPGTTTEGYGRRLKELVEGKRQVKKKWPTPKASAKNYGRPRKNNRGDLQAAVQMWPTLTAAEGSKIASRANYGQKGLSNHPRIVGEPTRPKGEKDRAGKKSYHGGTKTPPTYPTPTATDSVKRGKVAPRSGAMGLSETMGGQLNPEWVGWLMAFPYGWTDLKPLEMLRFQEWCDKHGKL